MAKKKDDGKRYIPCPGATLGVHAPNVFLEVRQTKKPGSVFMDCMICQVRMFGRGRWTSAGASTEQCRASLPAGVPAVDGRGAAL